MITWRLTIISLLIRILHHSALHSALRCNCHPKKVIQIEYGINQACVPPITFSEVCAKKIPGTFRTIALGLGIGKAGQGHCIIAGQWSTAIDSGTNVGAAFFDLLLIWISSILKQILVCLEIGQFIDPKFHTVNSLQNFSIYC